MAVNNIAIEIDGPDKTAKDTIAKYIEQLTNYKYTLNVRGVLTQLVYNDKFNRNNTYKIAYKPLIILLSASEEDIEIRCRMTKEPKYNSNKDREVYEKYAELLEEYGYAVVWRFDTSKDTPYKIGQSIARMLEDINIDDFVLTDIPSNCSIRPLYLYSREDLKDEDVYYGPLESIGQPDTNRPEYYDKEKERSKYEV